MDNGVGMTMEVGGGLGGGGRREKNWDIYNSLNNTSKKKKINYVTFHFHSTVYLYLTYYYSSFLRLMFSLWILKRFF